MQGNSQYFPSNINIKNIPLQNMNPNKNNNFIPNIIPVNNSPEMIDHPKIQIWPPKY